MACSDSCHRYMLYVVGQLFLAELGYSPGQIDDLKSRNVVAWKEQ